MSTERLAAGSTPDVHDRVRVHAALADATRLRIVDDLAQGDASPTELQAVLGISSNLMAHHLGVLVDAGLVARRRSEADRRRSYLRLVPGALANLHPQGMTPVSRVVFVCTANSARSQLAAALWAQASEVPVASAGTRPASGIAEGALAVARRRGLGLVQVEPMFLADVVTNDDYLVTVCDRAHEELHHGSTSPGLHWSIPDPVRIDDAAAFDAAFDELHHRISRLAPRLAPI